LGRDGNVHRRRRTLRAVPGGHHDVGGALRSGRASVTPSVVVAGTPPQWAQGQGLGLGGLVEPDPHHVRTRQVQAEAGDLGERRRGWRDGSRERLTRRGQCPAIPRVSPLPRPTTPSPRVPSPPSPERPGSWAITRTKPANSTRVRDPTDSARPTLAARRAREGRGRAGPETPGAIPVVSGRSPSPPPTAAVPRLGHSPL
jgi:hypothetical protein